MLIFRNNYLLSLLSGLLLGLGWCTYGEPLILFIGFIPLLFIEKRIRLSGSTRKGLKVFLLSYQSFLIWNLISTWWLWNSSHFGAIFTLLANSFLMSLVFCLYHWVARETKESLSKLFLVAAFIGFEKFHLNWELSWPWLNLGNAFSERIYWIQWYEYTGTFGGSLWVWIVNIYLYNILSLYGAVHIKFFLRKLATALLIISIPICISLIIYKNYKEELKPIDVLILQPNIDPYLEKYNITNLAIFDSLFYDIDSDNTFDLIVAPETVFPDFLNIKRIDDYYLTFKLKKKIAQYQKANFLGGISLFEESPMPNKYSNTLDNGKHLNIYNSAMMIDKRGIIQLYHKSKPVAGVEIFPYKNILKPLFGDLMIDLGGANSDITPQKERTVFQTTDGNIKAAPIICYESVFGEYTNAYVKNGAQMLGIITNDAWWGDTQGHKQLLSYARLRAIETRRSIARSANTGISAFINQRGDIISHLEYEKKGTLQDRINLNDKITFYVLYGDFIARIFIFLGGLILLLSISKKIKSYLNFSTS